MHPKTEQKIKNLINTMTVNPVQRELMEGILLGGLSLGLLELDDNFDYANAIAALTRCIAIIKTYALQPDDLLEGETQDTWVNAAMNDWPKEFPDPYLNKQLNPNQA